MHLFFGGRVKFPIDGKKVEVALSPWPVLWVDNMADLV